MTNTLPKFAEFEKNYQEALSIIDTFMVDDEYMSPPMSPLVHWMLTTSANPYSYLPNEWANSLDSAQGFAALLQHIHHALYDDGEICFVTVDGSPRIVFASPYEGGFRDIVLTKTEKHMEELVILGKKHKYTIQVLDITPAEFCDMIQEYKIKETKQFFTYDAARFGVEVAVKHYQKEYPDFFSISWVEDCEKEIEKT